MMLMCLQKRNVISTGGFPPSPCLPPPLHPFTRLLCGLVPPLDVDSALGCSVFRRFVHSFSRPPGYELPPTSYSNVNFFGSCLFPMSATDPVNETPRLPTASQLSSHLFCRIRRCRRWCNLCASFPVAVGSRNREWRACRSS